MPEARAMNELLNLNNISKTFFGNKVLDRISFNLYEGEVHCLCGENGAGKSTLIKILSGAYQPDAGSEIIFNGKKVVLNPHLAMDLGIQTIYQEFFLMPEMTVAENIMMGHEITNKFGFLDIKNMKLEAIGALSEIKASIDINEKIKNTSVAERQIVQISRALVQKAKVLILDEPTSALNSNEINELLSLLKHLSSKGIGIVYISHHLEEVLKIATRITVFRDGKKINTHKPKDINMSILIKDMVGRDVLSYYEREHLPLQNGILEIKNIEIDGVLKNVSFSVRKGEIIGIGGMVGSGRTELLEALYGLKKISSGKVILNGVDITPDSPIRAMKNGMCLITEDRQKSGLFLEHSSFWNFVAAKINIKKGFSLKVKEYSKAFIKFVSTFQIKINNKNAAIKFLSGGNQQKVILARWLYANSEIILLDEPTRGIDVGAKKEIYDLLSDLTKEGHYIIIVSSDLPELLSMSDKIIVMRKGKISAVLSNGDASEENVLSHALGGN